MILYGVVLSILLLICLDDVTIIRSRKTCLVFFLFLWGMSSFRSVTIGNDTRVYKQIFEHICMTGDISIYTGRYEKGYLYLNKILGAIVPNFTFFLMVVNAFIFSAYYLYIVQYSNNYPLSVFCFFTLGYWGSTTNVLRLQIAVACFLFAYMLIKNKKYKWSFVLGLIAFYFQRISLVYWLIFLVPRRLSKKYFYWMALISIIIWILLPQLIQLVGKIVPYYGNSYVSSTKYIIGEIKIATVAMALMRLIVVLFSIHQYKRYKRMLPSTKDLEIESQINLVFAAFIIMFISTRFNLIDRCETVFGISMLTLLPNIVERSKGANRFFIKLSICSVVLIYFLIVNIYRPEWNHIFPYHTFLFDLQ